MVSSLLFLLMLVSVFPTTFELNFLFNSFNATTNLKFFGDAHIDDSSFIKLTNASTQNSIGRAFYFAPITMNTTSSINQTTNISSSFNTSFVFSIIPGNKETSSNTGYGLAFVLSDSTSINGRYFGIFSDTTNPSVSPPVAIEFDTSQNTNLNDPDKNHVGINLNNAKSSEHQRAGYFDPVTREFVSINMRDGQNIRAWIDFVGPRNEVIVTIAPADLARPTQPLFTFYDVTIANYLSPQMFIGFSAATETSAEKQRVLAWSFSDEGSAIDINTAEFPVFQTSHSSSSSFSAQVITGISSICLLCLIGILLGSYWVWRKRKTEEEKIEEWELDYWPHRFSYGELREATKGFSKDELLGAGGFGEVFKGILPNNTEMAVKCINHDSEQGLREFMAEISSMGRLQHKNLVHMRGWCRKGNELMLVYDYMPNSSLNHWIFKNPKRVLGWEERRRVLVDVAEGLNYLHHGWDQLVLHRDIKPSNILLDSDMRGRLGDFGLAKLYQHGQAPGTTRVVGTLGYLAPELVNVGATAASDVYSFGVTMLVVVCGRSPIECYGDEEEEQLLVDWVRKLHGKGRICEVVHPKIAKECEGRVGDVKRVLMLGLACCSPDPQHRPTMKQVVAVLMGAVAEGLASAWLWSILSDQSGKLQGSGLELGEGEEVIGVSEGGRVGEDKSPLLHGHVSFSSDAYHYSFPPLSFSHSHSHPQSQM
ncbi:L-type lectin-domain containing receptor kinase S.1-like [Telopea speciosissima]|uniref:L-type lectin-domain containing receptor kinase S.1-like n=1 Tax=Telopea speciosissima TaxID=54955 RepID=UPI001CC609E5|nr:L-type lectin-domain containing receptor kinase S.1-like [Telopea speciosissima]